MILKSLLSIYLSSVVGNPVFILDLHILEVFHLSFIENNCFIESFGYIQKVLYLLYNIIRLYIVKIVKINKVNKIYTLNINIVYFTHIKKSSLSAGININSVKILKIKHV